MYELELGVLNIVKAPVGSGKTTWATQHLTELVDFQDEIHNLIRFDSFVNIKSKEEKRYCKMAT